MTVPIRDQLLSAVDGRRGIDAADRLCETCVALFDVDAAAISLVFDGATNGTLGCSDASADCNGEEVGLLAMCSNSLWLTCHRRNSAVPNQLMCTG